MNFEDRFYTINDKVCYQNTMSPFQQMRMMYLQTKFHTLFKAEGMSAPESMDIDLTPYLNVIEFKAPHLAVEFLNIVMCDAVTRKPGYATNMMTEDDFRKMSPTMTLEVVTDFFILNNLSKVLLDLSQMLEKAKAMISSAN